MLRAVDDDQVLDPARDEQLTAVDEPQVTRAQVATFVAGELGVKDLARHCFPVVVAGGDTAPGNPNLAGRTVG